jgi:arabinogalactan endo-1,4-beta-galactosidase
MKKLLLIISAVVLSYSLFAQPTVAQDFTVTDINGVEHNLFTYLDQGIFVEIVFYLDG